MHIHGSYREMMYYHSLPIWERYERATRIDFAVSNPYARIDLGSYSWAELYTPEIAQKVRKRLTVSSTLTTYLDAALKIRMNYSQWTSWVMNPSEQAPKVFESFANDRLLTFYLFFCDIMKVFRLDPRYPFLVCIQRDECKYYINGQADDDIDTIKCVTDMWNSMGSPLKESEWGITLLQIVEKLNDPNKIWRKRGNLTIGWHFWELTHQFGFHSSLLPAGDSTCTDKAYLEMPSFLTEISLAIAFDKEVNTLEIIHRLFPQFPQIIPSAIKIYYLLSSNYHEQVIFNYDTKERDTLSFVKQVLRKMFQLMPERCLKDRNMSLRNKSILDTIKNHPRLFSRWAVDPKMRKLYRKLIGDGETLYC